MTKKTFDKEQFDELKTFIDLTKDKPGPLMPIMQKAQEIFGYLPIEVQDFIAEAMGVPMSKVYGVATFYAQFAIEPKGEHLIGVCLGTACYVRGSQNVMTRVEEKLNIAPGKTTNDGKFTLEATRCLGCCGLAPVMMIDDRVFGSLTGDSKEIDDILAQF